jgi:hypothetical protein
MVTILPGLCQKHLDAIQSQEFQLLDAVAVAVADVVAVAGEYSKTSLREIMNLEIAIVATSTFIYRTLSGIFISHNIKRTFLHFNC